MAKKSDTVVDNNQMETNTEMETVTAVDPITVGSPSSDNILAAWRGLHQLFGARVERWDVAPDGVVAVGLTFDSQYDAAEIIDGISGRTRRVELVPAYFYVQGQEPESFTSSLDLTKWMQQYFRKPGEEGKSPDFVKQAIASYKKANAFPARKGRPKKVFRIEQISSLDPSLFAGVNVEEIDRLIATLKQAKTANAAV